MKQPNQTSPKQKHNVQITKVKREDYSNRQIGQAGYTRACNVIIDGVDTHCRIILSGSNTHTCLTIKYNVVLDNKEIKNHPDWREIRRLILAEAYKKFSGMAKGYFR